MLPPKDDEEEVQAEPPKNAELLAVNDGKLQRIKEEKQMKVVLLFIIIKC